MKKTNKRLLALLLAAVMCITSLPMSALAVYYAPGTVIDEDEETETPSVIFDEDNGTVYYSPGTVISDDDALPTGQQEETDTEYNGVPDNFVKENAEEVIVTEDGEEMGLFTVGEDGGIMTADTRASLKKAHFYVVWKNVLNDGANSEGFTRTARFTPRRASQERKLRRCSPLPLRRTNR